MPFVKQWRGAAVPLHTSPRSNHEKSREELVPERFTRVLIVAAAGLVACRSAAVVPERGRLAATQSRTEQARFDIAYRIGWGDPSTHTYDVQIDIGKVADDVVKLQMPVWSPGRYAPFFFARNVTQFSVTNGTTPVRWDRENGSLWRIYTKGETHVTVRYRVYANTLSGTFSVLDTAHANWNGPSMFMYVVDHKPDPVRLQSTRRPAGTSSTATPVPRTRPTMYSRTMIGSPTRRRRSRRR